MEIVELYFLSQPEWCRKTGLPVWMYYKFKQCKCGYMTITKVSNNEGYLREGEHARGDCYCFGEGFACRLDTVFSWYCTSNVTHIDWDKMEFTTLNSTYKFTIDEFSKDELKSRLNGTTKSKET